jgi:hypothetical protein
LPTGGRECVQSRSTANRDLWPWHGAHVRGSKAGITSWSRTAGAVSRGRRDRDSRDSKGIFLPGPLIQNSTLGGAAPCAYPSNLCGPIHRKLTYHPAIASQSAPAARTLTSGRPHVEKAVTRILHRPSRNRRRDRLDNSLDHVVSAISPHMRRRFADESARRRSASAARLRTGRNAGLHSWWVRR